MAVSGEPPERDIPPRANSQLVGHEGAELALRQLYDSGRLPHALLFSGPRGIGKATLAFRFARLVLAGGGEGAGLAVDPESGVFRRVAAGSHADLLTVEREYDARRRRLRADISVDSAREIAGFLRLTAAEGGWRVVVVDGAEEMTRNAANAVLKILEEPPRQALLLLVSHGPGRVLPTIRSRCRQFPLPSLAASVVAELVMRRRPGITCEEAAALAALASGSIGRALDLSDAGGGALYKRLLALTSVDGPPNVGKLYAFIDGLLAPDAENSYRAVEDLLSHLLGRIAVAAARGEAGGTEAVGGEAAAIRRLAGRSQPARWAKLRSDIAALFGRTEDLNLDRKQTMLDAFLAIAEAAR
jgi:DNA polymerase-3 subunit delta'